MRDASEFFATSPATLKTKDIDVQGVKLKVREFSLFERKTFMEKVDDVAERQVYLLVAATLNDEGNPLFTKQDLEKLRRLPPGFADEITRHVLELSGILVSKAATPASGDQAQESADEKPAEGTDSPNA